MKYAVFDFCETLISFQTGDRFIKFIIEESNDVNLINRYNKLQRKTNTYLYKAKRKLFKLKYKYDLLKIIKGLTKSEIANYARLYFEKELNPNIIEVVLNTLHQYNEAGYKIVILSAGYEPYILQFANNRIRESAIVIANEFAYKNDKFIGKIIGKDCYGKEKINRIKNKIDLNEIEVFVSDSLSDLPMFNISKEKIFVSKNKKNENIPSDWRQLVWD